FDERCIPTPPQRGCRVGGPGAGGVAPPSNTPGILSRRALPAGRLARLGATPDFHHGLLSGQTSRVKVTSGDAPATGRAGESRRGNRDRDDERQSSHGTPAAPSNHQFNYRNHQFNLLDYQITRLPDSPGSLRVRRADHDLLDPE